MIIKPKFLVVLFSLLTISCSKDEEIKDDNKIILEETEDVCSKMDDINFVKYCYANFDLNKDGKVSMTEASIVKDIQVSGRKIESLKGIEYFTGVEKINANNNLLTAVNLSNNKNLSILNLGSNKVQTLDLSNNLKITDLTASLEKQTIMDFSKQQDIQKINISGPELSAVNVKNNKSLTKLILMNSINLKKLDVSNNILLEELNISNTNIESVDISKASNLTALSCSDTQLAEVNTSSNLKLKTFWIEGNNRITKLDISKNLSLIILGAIDSKNLREIKVSKKQISILIYNDNHPSNLVYVD